MQVVRETISQKCTHLLPFLRSFLQCSLVRKVFDSASTNFKAFFKPLGNSLERLHSEMLKFPWDPKIQFFFEDGFSYKFVLFTRDKYRLSILCLISPIRLLPRGFEEMNVTQKYETVSGLYSMFQQSKCARFNRDLCRVMLSSYKNPSKLGLRHLGKKVDTTAFVLFMQKDWRKLTSYTSELPIPEYQYRPILHGVGHHHFCLKSFRDYEIFAQKF